ncbi:MAG: NAD(+)/NADH kinase [Desulfobulbaceae bacterium]|uniref:NAD kinase n=1 Tax=Candidatus Desulfatifera sulfidica TaxID=2841691 RepID=A0A8J6TD16_9BACT|nr:NAD(+)/NADH kinase [Candidatus Desulfatifera sulfidica]
MSAAPLPFRTSMDLSIRLAGIITKKDDGPAASFASELTTWLAKRNIDARLNSVIPELDILIILGGDGTLLHVAAEAARYSIPVIGINLGNLGFLTELTKDEALIALEEIINGTVTVEQRMMLKARLQGEKGNGSSCYGLNEVVINKGTLDKVLQLETRANGHTITTYKADGLIFSTPTGSTAYNLSAGGPLVYPGLASILVTPICPFMLGSRPMLLPPDTLLTTDFAGSNEQSAKIIVDGQPAWDLTAKTSLMIEAAEHPLLLITSPRRDYFAILRNKLHWGIQQ